MCVYLEGGGTVSNYEETRPLLLPFWLYWWGTKRKEKVKDLRNKNVGINEQGASISALASLREDMSRHWMSLQSALSRPLLQCDGSLSLICMWKTPQTFPKCMQRCVFNLNSPQPDPPNAHEPSRTD